MRFASDTDEEYDAAQAQVEAYNANAYIRHAQHELNCRESETLDIIRNEISEVDCVQLRPSNPALYAEQATIALSLAALFLQLFSFIDAAFGIGAPEPSKRKSCKRTTAAVLLGILVCIACIALFVRMQGYDSLSDVVDGAKDFMAKKPDGLSNSSSSGNELRAGLWSVSRTKKNIVESRQDTLYVCYGVAVLLVGSLLSSYLQAYRGKLNTCSSTFCVELPWCGPAYGPDRWASRKEGNLPSSYRESARGH